MIFENEITKSKRIEPNWKFCSERKPKKIGNFLIVEKIELCLSSSPTLYLNKHISDFKNFNPR